MIFLINLRFMCHLVFRLLAMKLTLLMLVEVISQLLRKPEENHQLSTV